MSDEERIIPIVPIEDRPRAYGAAPRLMISYAHKDEKWVVPRVKRLNRDYGYDIWIDYDDIRATQNWREEIARGIASSDAVIFMLSPQSVASEVCKSELATARDLEKHIFLVLVEKFDFNEALKTLGFKDAQVIVHFVEQDDEAGFAKLIKECEAYTDAQGNHPLVISELVKTLQTNPKLAEQHADYLRSLFARLDVVSLIDQFSDAPRETVSLREIYVRLKYNISFNIEVVDGQYTDWWLRDITDERQVRRGEEIPKPKSLHGFAPTGKALEAWQEELRQAWDEFRQRHDDKQAKKEEKYREALKDGTYYWHRIESEIAPALMPYCVILGEAGSGKSTVLKHLALCLAGERLQDPETNLSLLDFWPHPPRTPIFIGLRDFINAQFPDPKTPVTVDRFLAYLREHQLKPYALADYEDFLNRQMKQGDAFFLLDGLDEVPDGGNEHRIKQIKDFVTMLRRHYPDCPVVVATRPYAYARNDGYYLEDFGTVELSPLDTDRLEQLALKLFTVIMGREKAEEDLKAFQEQAEKLDERLRRTPLFFTLLASIWLRNRTVPAEERLPTSEGAVYRRCIAMMIERWTNKDARGQALIDMIGITQEDLYRLLHGVAYQLQCELATADEGETQDAVFTGGDVFDVANELEIAKISVEELLNALGERAGIIYEKGARKGKKRFYQFAHNTFREQLAATHLAQHADFPAIVHERLREDDLNHWREVMKFLPDELEPDALWSLVKGGIIAREEDLPTEGDDARWKSIFWTVRWLHDHDLPRDDEDMRQLWHKRVAKMLSRFIELGALAPKERAEMGRILSQLGDTRPGVGTLIRDGVKLPDIDWVTIPAGEFSYQDGTETLDYDYQIARYPVTYAQFQTFLDDPEGATDNRWWDGLPNESKPPFGDAYPTMQIAEQRFKYWNHPREMVNWYQAIAFCRWFSWRLGGDYALDAVEQWAVRLPTEFEWEKAARAMTGWAYPYGDEFDATKGNTDETGIGQTSAVGIFPSGDAPHWDKPISDLSGNVWEWCLTDYNNPQMKAVDENISSNSRRVVRGGSWDHDNLNARAVDRYYLSPDARYNDLGFRLCRPLSL